MERLLSPTLTVLAVIAAFVFVWVAHRDAADLEQQEVTRELVRIQGALAMAKQFDSAEMRRARRTLAAELLRRGTTSNVSEWRVLDFFETVADYDSQGRIDDDTVYSSFSYYVERYWIAADASIRASREKQHDPSFYGGFEELSHRVLERDGESESEDAQIQPEDVLRFLRDEAGLKD